MKALVFKNNKLRLAPDLPIPRPAEGEALVRVLLAGVCATDLEIIKGYMAFEGVLGHEFVGVVEQSGNAGLRGRRVVGEINIGCGECGLCTAGLGRHCPSREVLGITSRGGAFAEYLTLPESNLHILPDSVSDEEAVFVEPLAAAFEITTQVDIKTDDKVCILGDGKLGLLAAQVLSLHSGSLLVIGRHREKLAILEAQGIRTALAGWRSGAPETSKSGSKQPSGGEGPATNAPSGEKFDLVVDCSGSASGLETAMELVKPRGIIALKTTIAGSRPIDLNQLVINEITLLGSRCGPFPRAIQALADKSIEVKNLISARFPLDDGIEALRHAGQKGVLKVLLDVKLSG